jgi:hypothetical protein
LTGGPYSDSNVKYQPSEGCILRWTRICVVGALTAGIVLTVVAGVSFAAHPSGQVGYGATQVLGEQFIKPKSTGSSGWGLWLGLLVAFGILGCTGFYGWRRTRATEG